MELAADWGIVADYLLRACWFQCWCCVLQTVNYDSARGGISVLTEKGALTLSSLLIQNAQPKDSGSYVCAPSSAPAAATNIHVLAGTAVVKQHWLYWVFWNRNFVEKFVSFPFDWMNAPFDGAVLTRSNFFGSVSYRLIVYHQTVTLIGKKGGGNAIITLLKTFIFCLFVTVFWNLDGW